MVKYNSNKARACQNKSPGVLNSLQFLAIFIIVLACFRPYEIDFIRQYLTITTTSLVLVGFLLVLVSGNIRFTNKDMALIFIGAGIILCIAVDFISDWVAGKYYLEAYDARKNIVLTLIYALSMMRIFSYNKDNILKFVNIYIIIALIISIIGLIKDPGTIGTESLSGITIVPIVPSGMDKNTYSFICINAIWCISARNIFFNKGNVSKIADLFNYGLVIFFLICGIYVGSRTGVIYLSIIFLSYIKFRKIVFLLVLIALILFIFNREIGEIFSKTLYAQDHVESDSLRINLALLSLGAFISSPIFGVGIFKLIDIAYQSGLDTWEQNQMLVVLASYGLFGLFLIIYFLYKISCIAIKSKNKFIIFSVFACFFSYLTQPIFGYFANVFVVIIIYSMHHHNFFKIKKSNANE